MIRHTSTRGSALAITTAPVEPVATSSAGERDRRRERPAMVVRRLPATEDGVDLGPSDDLHPAGRLDIYL
jgi:hypothetical protein